MVNLSAGNTESSQFRDLFAEYGVSNPNSPATPSHLAISSDGMVESDCNPIPLALSQSSEESTTLDIDREVNIGPALGDNAKEIFLAAQHFSLKDRDEVLFERKKNLHLMEFLAAHGVPLTAVQDFVKEGKLSDFGNGRKVLIQSPPPFALAGGETTKAGLLNHGTGIKLGAPLNSKA